ncbi:type II restriction endonuclease [Holdemanella biformis]|uniref:type II restriction endonuclease n=1 Tax=Holdemanella biformis TaxID=1735 RepID=UPI003AB77DD3
MKRRQFEPWLETMRPSINTYGFYTDFAKVDMNVLSVRVSLNLLNTLIGAEDIENDFLKIISKYPETLEVVPILLAKRENEIYCQDEAKGNILYNFKKKNCTNEQYAYFMKQTGLFDLLQKKKINNLVDYVYGVEVGLDSNARKNRGGHQMEDLVESFLKKGGYKYYKEMRTPAVEEKFHLNLSRLTNGSSVVKRFDFVVETENQIYAIETNFYSSGGSKLNETARSFKMIAEETLFINGLTFIWITDGINGWRSTRTNLKETFDTMENLINITDLENGVLQDIIK